MLCSKSEGEIPDALIESPENGGYNNTTGKSRRKNMTYLTPEILITYEREGEQAKTYEERYKQAALGVFGTKRASNFLSVPPAMLQTDKQAVIRQYHSDPCLASLGILQWTMENIFLARSKHNIVGHLKQFDLCKCWVPAICDVRNCIYLGKKKMKNVSFKKC